MREPEWIDVATPSVQLRALTWGPADAPIALCLHGFPDTAYGWRKVAPALVDAGWWRRLCAAICRRATHRRLHRAAELGLLQPGMVARDERQQQPSRQLVVD